MQQIAESLPAFSSLFLNNLDDETVTLTNWVYVIYGLSVLLSASESRSIRFLIHAATFSSSWTSLTTSCW